MFAKIKSRGLHLSLSAVAIAVLSTTATPVLANDPVVLTFSTVGDSRQDPTAPDQTIIDANPNATGNCAIPTGTGTNPNPGLSGQDCKWLVNTTPFARILRGIQSQKSNLLFFNGDMIMGYGLADIPVTRASSVTIPKATTATPNPADTETPVALAISTPASISSIVTSDLMQFYQQYGFWRGMVANIMETGTYVVPVPGNHETECKRCGKKAQWQNELAWRDNMGDLIIDQNRITNILKPTGLTFNTNTWSLANTPSSTAVVNGVTNPDGITTSQQQLSFSFDVGTNHFAVINTDPAGNDGHAPWNWLDSDLTTAVNNGATHLFVFGHKPAFYYYYSGVNTPGTNETSSSTSSLYLTDATSATNFWNVITKHQATYFAGHEHIYNVSQPISNTVNTGGVSYQVIVGAGGSPFDDFKSTSANATPEVVGTVTGEPTGSVAAVATDRMYSWATVSIHQSGAVTMNTYGFDTTANGPIQSLGSFTLPAAK